MAIVHQPPNRYHYLLLFVHLATKHICHALKAPEGEPFVVPLAVPLIAGPSAMATVLLLMARQPGDWPNWLLAIFCAWLATGTILYFATSLGRILGKRGSMAIQRLFGMLLTTVAVQMFLTGIRQFFSIK